MVDNGDWDKDSSSQMCLDVSVRAELRNKQAIVTLLVLLPGQQSNLLKGCLGYASAAATLRHLLNQHQAVSEHTTHQPEPLTAHCASHSCRS
jgi:hypothetical protein